MQIIKNTCNKTFVFLFRRNSNFDAGKLEFVHDKGEITWCIALYMARPCVYI